MISGNEFWSLLHEVKQPNEILQIDPLETLDFVQNQTRIRILTKAPRIRFSGKLPGGSVADSRNAHCVRDSWLEGACVVNLM
jgi:hypothetical protein